MKKRHQRKRKELKASEQNVKDPQHIERIKREWNIKDWETQFALFQDGEVRYEKSVPLDDTTTLFPYSSKNTLIKNRVVLFPSKAEEYGTEEELIEEIRDFIYSYVDVSPLFEKVACYYVLFTWVYDDFEELPYLRVLGDAGSGKTRSLKTISSIYYML